MTELVFLLRPGEHTRSSIRPTTRYGHYVTLFVSQPHDHSQQTEALKSSREIQGLFLS